MPDTVIKVENLAKQYRLGDIGTGSVAHDINRWWYTVRGKEDPYLKIGEEKDRTSRSQSEYIWALRNINFDIKQGDAVGIIGRNGAGKSTLLKILSRTTSPTLGRIKIKGRIASLLEVGTGFHPELSGRENIFLNGAILGMTNAEIRKKFDEIVDFAGVERYIDTPVKRYSSGMYVRLAFGVAAHLEPDILIVDEVLAVGDAEFQKKALGKMQDVSSNKGRTVLFVSHNMGSIIQLCQSCILLQNGQISSIGESSKIVEGYYNNGMIDAYKKERNSEKEIYFLTIETVNENGRATNSFAHSSDIRLRMKIGINRTDPIHNIGLVLYTNDKKRIFTVNRSLSKFLKGGESEITLDFIIKGGLIAPSEYSFLAALNTKTGIVTYEWADDICPIKVYDDGTELAFAEGINYGCIILKDEWEIISKIN